MASLNDLSLFWRTTMRAYPWRKVAGQPMTRLDRPIEDCTIGLVTSAGLVPPNVAPFDESVKGGDFSYRIIQPEANLAEFNEFHRSETFDHSGVNEDKNLALPVDRLRELLQQGVIGGIAPRHFSFMGSITAPGRLTKRTAPEAAAMLVEDQVDIALLVPV